MAKLDRVLRQKEASSEHEVENAPKHVSTNVSKKVRWWIKGTPGFREIDINPEIAAEMLKYNDRNRPFIPSQVSKLYRAMQTAQFRQTPMPIIFSDKERLTDGQNRLRAIIESGTTQKQWCYFGDDDDNFYVFDTGASRTAGHIFAINGVGDYNNLAAAARFVLYYDNKWLGSVKSVSGPALAPSHEELWHFFETCLGLTESNRIGEAFRQRRLGSKSLMMAVHYICARKARKQADEFFLKAATGVGLKTAKEPASVLHTRLMEIAAEQGPKSKNRIAALSIKAWNAEREGVEKLRVLTYRPASKPDEKFPRAK